MYNVQTTLNINRGVLSKITEAAKFLGLSRTEIIVMLLKKIMNNDSSKACIHRSIKYQKCNNGENWHTFHISFNSDEYEYFLDLRKLLKMSLSYIVAFAVKKYLKTLISGKATDNNLFNNYILAKEDADGIIYWKLFWGVPKKLTEHLTFRDL